MKTLSFFFGLALVSHLGIAGTLPVIVTQPKNLTNSGTFSVAATNATDYQWRYNGMDIPGATNSSLSRSASDPAGYYMVVIKNTTGWVPSRLAYLSRDSGGYVPFSNYGNPHWQAQACYQISTLGGESQGQPVTNGTAQVVAGPEVDQMRPVGDIWGFEPWGPDWDGYFDMPPQLVPSVSPGQTVYYAVNLTYPTLPGSYTQPSRTLKLVAGGGTYPTPSADDIRFPIWPEWPEPWWVPEDSTATNQVRMPGETVLLTNSYLAYTDFGIPAAQWRRDGDPISGATNFVQLFGGSEGGEYRTILAITNFQANDAGIYDVEVFGNMFMVKPTITLSVQLANGPGMLQAPRFSGTNFVSDLLGIAGRNYRIEWSSRLTSWNDLFTVSNRTGVVTFTNYTGGDTARFYRARLLPY